VSFPEKAAALLLSMEKPLAGRLIRYFDEPEVKAAAEAAARLGNLSQRRLDEIIDEFVDALGTGSDLQGNAQAAARLLDGVVPAERINDIMSDIAGNSASRVWQTLQAVPEMTMAQYLMKQHPQVVTYVLSRLPGGRSALVLEQMPVAQRAEIVRRMLTLKEITGAALRVLEVNLQSELASTTARNSAADVHARIAGVLNKMNRETADATFASLSATRPKDAEKIKGLLFTFNDVVKLSDESRTKLFEGIPVEQTIVALHGASADLRTLIMSSLSQRGRRMIENELENGRVPPKSEIAKAQRAVADRALDLVERGVIDISGEG